MRKATAIVYTITQRLVEASPSTVTGQLSYLDTLLYILIYCDATHYFVGKNITERLGVELVKVVYRLR